MPHTQRSSIPMTLVPLLPQPSGYSPCFAFLDVPGGQSVLPSSPEKAGLTYMTMTVNLPFRKRAALTGFAVSCGKPSLVLGESRFEGHCGRIQGALLCRRVRTLSWCFRKTALGRRGYGCGGSGQEAVKGAWAGSCCWLGDRRRAAPGAKTGIAG